MQIGVDYSLADFNEKSWEKDAAKMAQTGVKTVRLVDISWSMLEPADNNFDFDWLDRLISIFAQNKISVIFCSPTSHPPLWLYQKSPFVVKVDKNGSIRPIGEKGNRCINSETFLDYAGRLIEALAARYASNPNIAAWQIDDEMEADICTCENCLEAFKAWLSEKYETIENINKAFGNPFIYNDWNQIAPPNSVSNPVLELEYKRFTCNSVRNFIRMQINNIRKFNDKAYVTTNTFIGENAPDYYKMNDLFSISLFDNNPVSESDSQAFYLDLMRGLKSKRFWVANQNNADKNSVAVNMQPDMIKGFALQALAHGADTVINYLWRAPVSGKNMFSQGIFDHSKIQSRRYDEFLDLCNTASKLSCIYKTKYISKIAILYSDESKFALNNQPQSQNFDYIKHLKLYYKAFSKLGANIDIIGHDCDLSEYKIVIAPSLFVNSNTATENLYRFVSNGGTLILTCRSGVKNQNNLCINESLPTDFKELAGIEIPEYSSLSDEKITITDKKGREYSCSQWIDNIKLSGAESYADYTSGLYNASPAVTVNKYCNGFVYYIGAVIDSALCYELANKLMKSCEVPRLKGMPEGIEITTRTNGMEDYIFFFNSSDKNASISLPKPMMSVVDGVEKDSINLKPYTIEIVRR